MPRKIPEKKPPKKALGKPLPPVEDEPIPTNEDIAELVALWDKHAPARYRGLLNAESKATLELTGEKPSGRFVWDDERLVYIVVSTGRVISKQELHNAVRAFSQRLARV